MHLNIHLGVTLICFVEKTSLTFLSEQPPSTEVFPAQRLTGESSWSLTGCTAATLIPAVCHIKIQPRLPERERAQPVFPPSQPSPCNLHHRRDKTVVKNECFCEEED